MMNRRNLFSVLFGGIAAAFAVGCNPGKRRIRELTKPEIITNRTNEAHKLKCSQLLSDKDILTKWLHYSDEEATEILASRMIQK